MNAMNSSEKGKRQVRKHKLNEFRMMDGWRERTLNEFRVMDGESAD